MKTNTKQWLVVTAAYLAPVALGLGAALLLTMVLQ